MPTLFVVCGCNGSGKSSFIQSTSYLQALPVIDPDRMFTKLRDWRNVVLDINRLLDGKSNVVYETTLAGKTALQRIAAAKKAGYVVNTIFIGTRDPGINISRVFERVRAGGHDISDADIERRWKTSLDHLPSIATCSENVLLIDNSQTELDQWFRHVALFGNDVQIAAVVPEWAETVIETITRDRQWTT